MRKTNKTSGVIRASYRIEKPMWLLIVQMVGTLAVMAIILKWIIDNR